MAKHDTITLTGNTYAYRDEIKRIGGTWDAGKKAWIVQPGTMSERAEQASVIFRLRKHGIKVS